MKRIKSLIAVSTIIFSLFSYKVSFAENLKYNDVAPANRRVKFTFGLTSSLSKVGHSYPKSQGFLGQNSYVVVIDTGVDTNHPFLKNKVVLEACFAATCPNGKRSMVGAGAARPVHWHGTHVAGIIAGQNDTFTGVAPASNIIAVNVFDPSGAAYDSDIVSALRWVNQISSQYNIVAVNMSLGTSRTFPSTCDGYIPAMTDQIYFLSQKNIATVVSSGNSYAIGMSSPACISHSVSVAATYTNSDLITEFSNISNVTTFAAPGHNINSSAGTGYRTSSGTSMSAPHVSGAFAVYRSKFGISSVNKIVHDFKHNSPQAYDSYSQIFVSRIDFTNLFSENGTPPPSTVPNPSTTTTTSPVVTTTTTVVPIITHISPPSLLDLYGGFTTSVYVKYRVPMINRNIISHYNLYCNDVAVYVIPHQSQWSVDTYRLPVPAKMIDYCQMTTVLKNGSESAKSTISRIYPRNK